MEYIDKKRYRLFIGIDFGISKISVMTSRGSKRIFENLPEPYKNLFIKGKFNSYKSAFSQSKYDTTMEEDIKGVVCKLIDEILFSVIEPPLHSYTSGVISISGGISPKGLELLEHIIRKHIKIADIIPSPVAIAYSMADPGHCLIVDIGANTVDICRFYGAAPSIDDHVVLYKAGDFIDKKLGVLLKKKFKNDFVYPYLLHLCKEKYGAVYEKKMKFKMKFMVNNRVCIYDIASEIAEASYAILPGIVRAINDLISTYDAEFTGELKKNIFLSGRGAMMSGLARRIEYELDKGQNIRVMLVSDPLYAPAIGSLSMARDLTACAKKTNMY